MRSWVASTPRASVALLTSALAVLLACSACETSGERDEGTAFEERECGETNVARDASPSVERLASVLSGTAYRTDDGGVRIVLAPIIDVASGQVRADLEASDLAITAAGESVDEFTVEATGGETTAAVDVVFVLDTTGSMAWAIDGVRRGVGEFARGLAASGLDIRFGGIEFGDGVRSSTALGGDGALRDWLGRLTAIGGNDAPENPVDALLAAAGSFGFRDEALRYYIVVTDTGFHELSDGSGCADHNLAELVDAIRGQALLAVVYARLGDPSGVHPQMLVAGIGGLYVLVDIVEALTEFDISTDTPTDDVLRDVHVIDIPPGAISAAVDAVTVTYTSDTGNLTTTMPIRGEGGDPVGEDMGADAERDMGSDLAEEDAEVGDSSDDLTAADLDDENDLGADGTDDAGDAGESACATLCAARVEDGRGFCVQDGYFSPEACTTYCEDRSLPWGDDEWGAFTSCVETDPLCFQTIDQCMLSDLFADEIASETPVDQHAVVRGAGFDAHSGRWVFAELSRQFGVDSVLDQTSVRDGAFELTWSFTEEIPLSGGVRVVMYLDTNENVSCDLEADLTFLGEATPRFGTEPLEYLYEVRPEDGAEGLMAESVCDTF